MQKARPEPRDKRPRRGFVRIAGASIGLLLAALVLVPLLAVALMQVGLGQGREAGPAAVPSIIPPVEAAQMLGVAADALSRDAGPEGQGFRVQVVSRSTLHAKPGGPLIEIPHPTERHITLGHAEEYYLGGTIAEGIVAPDGFWLQMRQGPATREASADFEASPVTLAALVRDTKQWRNDGEGWYESDVLPGIGIDPRTLGLLPDLLREATGVVSLGDDPVGDRELALIRGDGKVADAPGLMAVDAEPFTEFVGPLTFGLDDQDRLAQLTARLRNTTVTDFDLIVETTVSFLYDGAIGELPEPLPAAPPAATPPPDPTDQD